MSSKNQAETFSNFRYRKIVHYFLILCILLIQIILAGFFYNELMNKKNLAFIEKQLNEINSLENLTNDSRKELLISQDHFQKYLITNDKKNIWICISHLSTSSQKIQTASTVIKIRDCKASSCLRKKILLSSKNLRCWRILLISFLQNRVLKSVKIFRN